MAEALLRKRIADKLGCGSDEVEDRGVLVTSAGIAAMTGGRATREAVNAMAGRELDLSLHESQPVSDRLIRNADVILTMTRSHREAVVMHWPDAAARTRLFCLDGCDVPDPIGGTPETYAHCADQIDRQLDGLVEQWDLQTPKTIYPET